VLFDVTLIWLVPEDVCCPKVVETALNPVELAGLNSTVPEPPSILAALMTVMVFVPVEVMPVGN
jgi:hypothetical protein